MRRINYKNDIPPLLLSLKVDENQITVPECDFIVRFYIDGYEGRHYDCSHIGGVWSNCEPSEDGTKLVCYINNQRLGIGELCAEFHYIRPDRRYSDGSQKSVVIIGSTELGVELVEDNGDAVTEAAIDVTLPFIYRTAYEIARDHGYTGTAEDFYSALASVVGIADAEKKRVTAEITRNANEQERIENEENRLNAESERVNAEAQRVRNEAIRGDAESDRVEQEEDRKAKFEEITGFIATVRANEGNRESNERERQTNEDTRITEEAKRVEAEKKRATEFEQQKLDLAGKIDRSGDEMGGDLIFTDNAGVSFRTSNGGAHNMFNDTDDVAKFTVDNGDTFEFKQNETPSKNSSAVVVSKNLYNALDMTLESMGSALDGDAAYHAEAGDKIFNPDTCKIQRYNSTIGGFEDLCDPIDGKLYANKMTGYIYRWDTKTKNMVFVGGVKAYTKDEADSRFAKLKDETQTVNVKELNANNFVSAKSMWIGDEGLLLNGDGNGHLTVEQDEVITDVTLNEKLATKADDVAYGVEWNNGQPTGEMQETTVKEATKNTTVATLFLGQSFNALETEVEKKADKTELDTINANVDQKVSKTDIVQNTGQSTTSVMSQKAVSDIVDELELKVDGIVEDEKSFEDAIRDQVNNYKPIVIEGNVTNAADEEDITSENGLLKLKDRSALNGMGYVILRKGKTFAEQVTKQNTIYEVRYDFDLNGAEITIPENCVLKFEGGNLSNGVIKGNNTVIVNPSNSQIFKNVYFHTSDITSTYNGAGLFICKEIYAKWFGIVPNDGINHQEKFEQLSSLLCCCENINLFFEKGTYKFGKQDDVNQRNFNNCPYALILYIGHCLLKFIGNNIKSVKIYGNGASFEDVCKHKVGWFNADGTPDYDGQGGAIYEEKKFAFSGSGIVFMDLANIENTYIENLTIDLHYQDYEYGGGIIPAILSHGIDFTNTYNNNIKLYNCVSKNCLTDGFHIAGYNNLNLDTAIAYNCMRTGFATGLGKRFVCKNSKFYCDYAPFIPINPNGGKKIYIMEAPHACMNLELTLEGETLEYAYIDNCTFGDCLNKDYQLNILKQVKNCFITNCEFRRTKALINENSAWNISMNGNLYMDNIILINACYKNPITTLNIPDAHALVGRVSVFAETWDTIDEDYNGKRFELATFGAQKENCKVCEVNIYLKDKFGISPINSPDMQYVDNIYIYIQEEIKNGDKLIGPLPHVDNLYIIDYNTEHTIAEADRPRLENLELVKNFYYTKTSSEDNIPTIRFQDIIYKQEINWVNNERYAPIQASRINMFDGVYNTPSQIAFSCLTDPATIKGLPTGSLSFRANMNDEYCRFWKWNGEKFDEFFATPRRTSRLSFNTLDEFKTFCQTEGVTKLYKGERVLIANVTYYGTGIGINLVNSNGIDVESKSSGTFTERPSASPIGFQYFCTDKQTAEGQNSGIMIYHKGNGIWVDALGRVVV